MHPHVITSPLEVVPLIVAELVANAVWLITSATVVISCASHFQPFVAVGRVMVTVHVPVVPLANLPAEAPPNGTVSEHPLTEFVPPIRYPAGPCSSDPDVVNKLVRPPP